MKRWILNALLCTIVFVLFPCTVKADEAQAQKTTVILHSGISGNLNWSIDQEGCFRLNGSGNYELPSGNVDNVHMSGLAWTPYANQIRTAVVNVSNITTLNSLFVDCSNLTDVDLSGLDTDSVTDMQHMFDGCKSLCQINLSNFNTENAVDLSYMFMDCINLETVDVSRFSTGNAKYLTGMFFNCASLTRIDVRQFITGNVTSMATMFSGCTNLEEVDVSGFNTGNTVMMTGMFSGCSSLKNLDVSKFDTHSIRYGYDNMFLNCRNLKELDLRSFIMEVGMSGNAMLEGCDSLERIYVPPSVQAEIDLPQPDNSCQWQDQSGKTYTKFPINAQSAVLLTRIKRAWAAGDVNGDDSVDIQDLRLVLRYVCNKTQLDEQQIRIADVEKSDGKVDIQDLRKILRFVCKKIDKL